MGDSIMGRRGGGSMKAWRKRDTDQWLATQRAINEDNPRTSDDFGNGEVGGDRNWTSPVYGQTTEEQDVTVSFGQGYRDGHTGIASGHVSGSQYYNKRDGHDHYGPNGESHADRGAFRD